MLSRADLARPLPPGDGWEPRWEPRSELDVVTSTNLCGATDSFRRRLVLGPGPRLAKGRDQLSGRWRTAKVQLRRPVSAVGTDATVYPSALSWAGMQART